MHRQSLKQIKQAVRDVFSFPGGYEMHLVMADGEAVCMKCARKEWRNIYKETKAKPCDWPDKQWRAEGVDIYWEGPSMQCAHCDNGIESIYGDPEENKACD